MPQLRSAHATKYTLLLDPETRSYQRHLRRNTDIVFSDLLRALVARIAIDKTLEAEIFAVCGGGYDEDLAPQTAIPDAQNGPDRPDLSAGETPAGNTEAAPSTDVESSGFWGDDDASA